MIGTVGKAFEVAVNVVSRLYLAAQIRINSWIFKREQTHNTTQKIPTELRCSGENAKVFLNMTNDPDSLKEVEAFESGEWLYAPMMAR